MGLRTYCYIVIVRTLSYSIQYTFMRPFAFNMELSPLTRQLLPLFAPFQSYITLAAELIEEYLILLLESPALRSLPLGDFYTMADELVDHGWWSKPHWDWEIFAIHPLLEMNANRLFASIPIEQQEAVYLSFIRYYEQVLAPKAIRPYVTAPNASGLSLGVFVARYEAANLEAAVLAAAAHNQLTDALYTSLDSYYLAANQHEERIRTSSRLLEQFSEAIRQSGLLPTMLFHRASALRQLGRYEKAKNAIEKALATVPATDNRRAVLLQRLGNVLRDLGHYQEAVPHFEAALAVFEEVGDQQKIAEMYQNLGVISKEEKDYDTFLLFSEKALGMYEKQGREHFQAMAYQNLAAAWLEKGENEKALEVYQEALRIFEIYKDQTGKASVSRSMGVVYSGQGKLAEASEYFRRALETYLLIGTPDEKGLAWFDYGSTALKSGNTDEALEYYRQAWQTYNSPRGKGRALHMAAYIHSNYQKDPEASIGFYRSAIAEFEKIPRGSDWAEARYNLGNVLLELGRKKESIQCYEPAARWFEAEGLPVDKTAAYLYHNLTLACYQAGEMKKGEKYLQQAKALYEALGDEDSQVELLRDIEESNKTDTPKSEDICNTSHDLE